MLPVTDTEGTSTPERVEEFVSPLLRARRVQQILVCGSNRLIALATRLAAPFGVDVQVSLEARMACGIGYCHGCSHGAVGESEEAPLVCREGPVFAASLEAATFRPGHGSAEAQPATGHPAEPAGRPARPSNGRGRRANG